MKSRWHHRSTDDQHPPVEMRFIDMFMTALGSLVFLALLLVFLLPKTSQSKAQDEELKRLQQENLQLRRQIPQQAAASQTNTKTEDKEIVLRGFEILLVTSGCNQQPELYVRTEEKIVNFRTGEPQADAIAFDASNPRSRTILVGQRYFDVGLDAVTKMAAEKGNVHTRIFQAVARSSGSYSVYAGLNDPTSEEGRGGCLIYPYYMVAGGPVRGDALTLTQRRPYAWLRRFSIKTDGQTTVGTSPRADQGFLRDLAEFSKKQSEILCDRKAVCGTMDAHYAVLVPPSPPPAYSSGIAHLANGEYDLSIADFDGAIRADPAFVEAWVSRGSAYRAKGDTARAISDFDEALRLEPTANRFNTRGLVYAAKGDLDRAISDYGEAIKLDPTFNLSYHNRGLAHANKGNVAAAISDFSDAIRLDPGYAGSFSGRANAYRAAREFDKALADDDKAIALAPTAARYNDRGLVYADKGHDDRAIADFTEALRLDPKSAAAFYNRGLALQRKGEVDRAIVDYGEALRAAGDKPSADLYDHRGQAYLARGDIARAIGDYDSAIARDGRYSPGYEHRAEAERRRGNLDRAIADANTAIKIQASPERFSGRALIWIARGDTERAIGDLSEALRLDPKFSRFYLERGRAYFLAESLGKAQSDFGQALELKPEDGYAAAWLDLAERRNGIRSRLAEGRSRIDMTAWPGPVVRLLLGELSRQDVVEAAQSPDTKIARRQLCEARFFAGELALLHGLKDDAASEFKLVSDVCQDFPLERAIAGKEMKTLQARR